MKEKYNEFSPSKSRSFMIVEVIKDELLNGTLKPGDKLPNETLLSEKFNVSRTPVREAMKILEAIGVIEIKRGSGMFITNSSTGFTLNSLVFSLIMHSSDTEKLIEFRQHFEVLLMNIIITNWDESKYEKIERVYLSQVERLHKGLTPTELADIDLEFHFALLEITENPFVIEVGKTIYELYRPKMILNKKSSNIELTLATHKAYLEALKDKTGMTTPEQIKDRIINNVKWLQE